jgi:hypothetical protein
MYGVMWGAAVGSKLHCGHAQNELMAAFYAHVIIQRALFLVEQDCSS